MDEREKYERVWSEPAYRQSSPAELLVPDFLTCWRGSLSRPIVNDFGCGSGRAGLALWRQGFDVLMFDFAANCLDQAVRDKLGERLAFVQADLSELDQSIRDAEWGFCCDVLEHIPEHLVERVVHNIAVGSQNAYLNISGRPDVFGPQFLGFPLHVTVRSAAYWQELLSRFWSRVEPRAGTDDDYVFVCRGRLPGIRGKVRTVTQAAGSEDEYKAVADTLMQLLRGAPPVVRPPLAMMQDMGCSTIEHFDKVMIEYSGELIWKCRLDHSSNLLDLGSGCGRMASGLVYYVDTGNYLGIDVWREGIRWCQENITPVRPNFRFETVRAANNYYYEDDRGIPNQFDLSFVPRNYFDCVFALSVFTHLRLCDAEQYFKLIADCLRSGGTAYLTFYVMDEHVRRYVAETGEHRALAPAGDGMWYAYQHKHFFSGYEEWRLFQLFHDNGLEIVERSPGSWAKKPHSRLDQDWFLLRRRLEA